MEKEILIVGGNTLNGIVHNQTSKNAVLPMIAGSILNCKEIVIKNVPKLLDVFNMIKIIEDLGAKVYVDNKDIVIDNSNINKFKIDENLTRSLRSSIFMLGPMLARFKKCTVCYPGGCDIGNRPIDLHLKGLKELGVSIIERNGFIICDATNMHSGVVNLDFASVGATENIMMSSVFSKGYTVILNAAREPEIVDLQNFLNAMGCKISGAGTDKISIEGVERLHTTEYTPEGDRITAGTYLIATAMCGGNLYIDNVNTNDLASLTSKLEKAGCELNYTDNSIELSSNGNLQCIDKIETQTYPGFPTDLQAQIMAMQTVSNGVSVIVENLFENRFKHVKELIKLGADIKTQDRVAVIKGVDKLKGADVSATDLRGGASLVLAGLKAEGYTTVHNINHILRGYENIDEVLSCLGASIKIKNSIENNPNLYIR